MFFLLKRITIKYLTIVKRAFHQKVFERLWFDENLMLVYSTHFRLFLLGTEENRLALRNSKNKLFLSSNQVVNHLWLAVMRHRSRKRHRYP